MNPLISHVPANDAAEDTHRYWTDERLERWSMGLLAAIVAAFGLLLLVWPVPGVV